MNRLKAEVVPKPKIQTYLIRLMYDLYTQYYDGSSWEIFQQDLSNKDYVILLWNEEEKLQGFSTLAILSFEFEGKPKRAIFSGDTIIHHQYWGEQTLPLAWCRLAGKIKGEAMEQPLYWFLIVKGYRTYRYLSVFAQRFYPTWRYPTPVNYQALMDYLAQTKFGDDYDPASGLIRFPSSLGHLRGSWAEIKEGFQHKPDVRYFLERNPEYYKGHELVCLMELSEENMRSHAQRGFLEGLRDARSEG
ncbi:hypothetical protein H6F50_17855 [Coleofasciculus sp. FACHB-712]|uniref:hypothetical protein n=1 Tax=Cyanophyceae TaxID=3028117 RepID=UPI0016824BE7|nr:MULTISPECIES: hypothetical protein [unclassified Coleofasciculus]MBD1891541.1 hypothetical protein [Coleofasciculus sp. FACHB-SPT9]MBD1894982.1 hypothetical protein [Coleofasciculus sp. FACHB-129]MBD1944201.1 hypothetical protein [Coleofasciculus sp. FACHB-712]MBD2538578.1 hypothetical protein [Coleofasciculus sp. FACHB-SPT36]